MVLKFKGDISKWNKSNVTNMADMFNGAMEFNSDLPTKEVLRDDGTSFIAWNVGNVTNMAVFKMQENLMEIYLNGMYQMLEI